MPDILIDPLSTSLLRILRRVDNRLGEPPAEHRILERDVTGPVLVVEGIVARIDIVVSPRQLPGISREYAGREAGIVRTLQYRENQLVVMALVELEEAWAGAVSRPYIFDRVATC